MILYAMRAHSFAMFAKDGAAHKASYDILVFSTAA